MTVGAPELRPEEFVLFRDFLYERTGLYFPDGKEYFLQNRLSERMAEVRCPSYQDYYFQLKYDPSQEEIEHLLDVVTTRETSFFRNPPQIEAFRAKILPQLVERKQQAGDRAVRLWSAGCASGEEPYTLATLLLDGLPFSSLWNVQIIASDISRAALNQARRGIYPREALRSLPPQWVQRHFLTVGGTYHVRDEVKRLVQFSHLNLADANRMRLIQQVDIVFCRNVLIYFGAEVKRTVVDGFYRALVPSGYLFLGHAETLHNVSAAFRILPYDGAFVYQKG
jgi:chemotaxis protein methyltransferase CheR